MSKYVLDSGFFVNSRIYYPEIFTSFWGKIDERIQAQTITSVMEVRKELENYGGKQKYLLSWIKYYKSIFTEPTSDEQQKLKSIFEISAFRQLVDSKKQMRGGLCADPFVIAKAWATKSTVVTGELSAKGKVKIPDVCEHFNILYKTPEQFMKLQKWRF